MRYVQSLALLLLSLTGLACTTEETTGGTTTGETPYVADFIQMSYEVMPGTGFMVDYSDDPYSERSAFTTQLETDLVPDIFSAVGQDFSKLDTEAVPGGYLLALNPSLQTRVPEDWAATEKSAAALGYVMLQWSVLLTDFTPKDTGNTGFGVVEFSGGTLDDKLAGDFFTHANTVNAGLGGGFFAFGNSMYFLNIADGQGMPYSGLSDDVFIAELGKAATAFTGAVAKLSSSGKCDARFVENDWDASKAGEDYLAKLSSLEQAKKDQLTALQTEFKTLFQGAVTQYGWDMAPMPKIAPPSYQRRGFYGPHFAQQLQLKN